MPKTKIAIFISGRGSNMRALIEAGRDPAYPAQIALVFADNKNAQGLKAAQAANIASYALERQDFRDKAAYEQAILELMAQHQIELIALAGYMKILSAQFIQSYGKPILNIHPSLLPAFKGLDAQQQALEAGVTIAGCSVHLVSAQIDSGRILGQAALPIAPNETKESLSEKLLQLEHLLYKKTLLTFLEAQKGRYRAAADLSDNTALSYVDYGNYGDHGGYVLSIKI